MNAAARKAPGPLTIIQSGGVGSGTAPVYCFHAFGGSVAPYGALAPHVGREHRFHGLQAVGIVDGDEPDRSVLDMAYRYALAIAAEPPVGWCVFLGYSMGGLLALESARLLAHVLDARPLVVAIDSDPAYRTTGPGDAWSILVRQVLDLDLPVEGLAELPRPEALATVRSAASRQGRLPARFNLDRLGRMLDVCAANAAAAARYRPQPYPGPVVSIRSGGTPPDGAPPDLWTPYIADLAVQYLPGEHHSIMSASGYPTLGRRIRDLLPTPPGGRAERSARSSSHTSQPITS